ncbi:hypothetical protein [Bradyrhizobium sp. AZCC 1721]|uniref:hypothetical protein n=1 Tax=Bradyrhizobium sp. AZCC 1721 TaxID=3117016 RepID=UPI002FF0234E
MRPSPHSNHFILETFDCDLWCPIAQMRFHVGDIGPLRSILGEDTSQDPDLNHTYCLGDDQLAALIERFDVKYDRAEFNSTDLAIALFRWHDASEAPYLIHTGYELPLLLDGRKKLARMSHACPPMTFDGEHRFDHWVAEGMLHREEIIEPSDPPGKKYFGHRTVLYTPKGEEWRIPAHNLIWQASAKSAGWNEHLERLEGMLFGYEDWQNDWWIDWQRGRGRFDGLCFCCSVTLAGLAWMEAAGFRALPPIEKPDLIIANYDADAKNDLEALMLESADSVALVRFNLPGQEAKNFIDLRNYGPWHVGAERIGELNKHLRGSVAIVARRNEAGHLQRT